MAKRELISEEHRLFRIAGGAVYCRQQVDGLGRREFPIGKTYDGPLPDISVKDLKALIAAKDRKVAEMIRQGKPKPAALVRFEDLAQEIIEEKRAKSFKTFESADIHLGKHLIPFMNERHPYLYEFSEKGETIWQEYIDYKRSQRQGVKFLNHRKHLNMVLLRAFERRILDRKVKLYDPDPEIDVGKVLEPEQVKRLYDAAGPSLKLQIMMAFTMGLRKSEILRLEWTRVDFETNELIFRKQNTKTRKPRIVPMNPWVRSSLEARFAKKKGPYVFWARGNYQAYQANNKSAWRSAKKEAKVSARFHDLRHTFITHSVRAGMNPVLICKYAGVSQEVMAKVYCHLDTRDLRQLAQSVGGKLGEGLRNVQHVQ